MAINGCPTGRANKEMNDNIETLSRVLDQMAVRLARTYSIPSSVCTTVNEQIISTASSKGSEYPWIFTVSDMKTISGNLIDNDPYNYVTFLNRNTFNMVVFRLMKRGILTSSYLRVPQQVDRKVFTHFRGIDHREFLLMSSIDTNLRQLTVHGSNKPTTSEMGGELLCRFVAAFALHGAMAFEGFQKKLLTLPIRDIMWKFNFITILLAKTDDAKTPNPGASWFYRYFLPPTAEFYLLRMFKEAGKKHWLKLVGKKKTACQHLLQDIANETEDSFEETFLNWTKAIADDFNIDTSFTVRRFQDVCVPYLAMKYPIFMLSVQTRSLVSDSLDMRNFAPLLGLKMRQPQPLKPTVKKRKSRSKIPKINDRQLSQTVKQIVRLRRSINGKLTPIQARTLVLAIRELTDKIKQNKQNSNGIVPPIIENHLLYWNWLCHLIEIAPSINITGGTICNYSSGVGKNFVPLLHDASLCEMTREVLEERCLHYLSQYETPQQVKHLTKFINYLSKQEIIPEDQKPRLRSKQFYKARIRHPKPLFQFAQIDDILKATNDKVLRLMIILGFYAGLRAGEFVKLEIPHLIIEEGAVLCIRHSKTRNGWRNIPLHLLMPEVYLDELIEYWRAIEMERGHIGLVFGNGATPLNKSNLASRVAALFRKKLGLHIRFHHLRHSFANWFLIRWFCAVYGTDLVRPNASFKRHILFSTEYLSKINLLLFGKQKLKKGQVHFSHPFAVLARLIGHGSPKTTIENYIHTIDFLTALFLKRKFINSQLSLSSKDIAGLLGVSYPSLPPEFKGKRAKQVNIQSIIGVLKRLLGI